MVMLPVTGPFRINSPMPVAAAARDIAALGRAGRAAESAAVPAVAAPVAASDRGDEYFQRLVKLVPSEVLALYLTFKEIANDWLGIWTAICCLLVIFVRTVGTRKAGKPIQIFAVAVATISFILWVYATGGYFFRFKLPTNIPGIASVSVGVWTFLIPYIYNGD